MHNIFNILSFSFYSLTFILLSQLSYSADLDLNVVWKTNQKTMLESAPTVADINGDGKDEVLVAGREELIALDGKGKELWRWNTRKRFVTYPTVLKQVNKPALIYVADNGGLFTCINGDGKVVWQAELEGGGDWSASAVEDLDGDGVPEVVQSDSKGFVWVFNALTGDVIQKTAVHGKPVSPSIGDLDNDGILDYVVATNEGLIYAIEADGTIAWERKIGGFSETWATSSPVIYAASDEKSYVVAASSSGEIFCMNGAGEVQWQHQVRGPVASTISVGDFDQNGMADIFLITQLGVIYRFDETGSVIWDIDMQGRSLAPGAIIDINNDGKLEYILSTQQGNLLALDNDGEVIFDHQFDNRTINVTPAFGDVHGSSKNLEMVVTGGESGFTYCFSTSAIKDAISHWPTYRGNIQNTGSWFGLTKSNILRMVPVNLAWDKALAGEDIVFSIYNPNPSDEFFNANATCIRPDGSKQKSISKVIGKMGQLQMSVNFDIPGSYAFTWSLTDQKDRVLVKGEKEITIMPLSNERKLIEYAISELTIASQKVESILPLSAKALENQRLILELNAKILAIGSNQKSSANISMAKLVKDAKRALELSSIIEGATAFGQSTSLIAFEGTKWDSRNVGKQLPAMIENPLILSHDVVPGEHQPISLKLFNITNQTLQVKVEIGETEKNIKVTPLYSVLTLSSLGKNSWDALPEMDESGVISIPSLSTREVWMDVNIGEVKTGHHNITIHLYALNGAGVIDAPNNPHAVPAPETKVELTLNVLPFNMAPSGDFRLCTWSPSSGPVIEDLLAHGNNVFIIPQGRLTYKNDEFMDVDFTEIGDIIDQFEETDVFLLSYGLPAIKGEFGTEEFKSDYMSYLDKMIKFLADKGIDRDHFALYAIDEPGGHGWDAVNKVVDFGKLVHITYSDVMIYMDGGGELPMFKAMAEVIDVWVPPYDWLPESIPEMDVVRSDGKNLWSYNCTYSTSRPVGPNVKNINIPYEFRTAALMAFNQGATGIGYWCYNAGKENPWMRIKSEYNLVYPGRTKPVTSRRWEAIREGIEDARILIALQKYLQRTGNDALDVEVRNKIQHLINVKLPDLVDGGFQAMKIGLSRESIDLLSNETKINAFRTEMLECVKSIADNSN